MIKPTFQRQNSTLDYRAQVEECAIALQVHLDEMRSTYPADMIMSAMGSLLATGLHRIMKEGILPRDQLTRVMRDITFLAFNGTTPPSTQ